MIKKIICILILLLIPMVSFATDYYVRPITGEYNDEDGSDYDNAFDGFAGINWSNVDSGNGKLFVCGTFSETMTIGQSGEDGTPIQVVSCTIANGASADDPGIIDGGDSRQSAIVADTKDWITIDGITAQNPSGGSDGLFRFLTCDNIVVKNVTALADVNRGIMFHQSGTVSVQNAYVDVGSAGATTETDGIYFGGGYGGNPALGAKTIDGSTIYQRSGDPNTYHCDNIQTYNFANFTLTNSFIKSFAGRTEYGQQSQTVLLEDLDGTITLYNNVIIGYSDTNWDGAVLAYNGGSWAGNLYVWNNYVEHTGAHIALGVYIGAGYIKEIKNNILVTPSGGLAMKIATPSDKTGVDYNLLYTNNSTVASDGGGDKTWAQWQAAGYDDDGGVNTDPSLDANYAPDSAGDPEVNTGTTIASFSTDKNGISRPQGASWDIGAYEYQAEEAQTINNPIIMVIQ